MWGDLCNLKPQVPKQFQIRLSNIEKLSCAERILLLCVAALNYENVVETGSETEEEDKLPVSEEDPLINGSPASLTNPEASPRAESHGLLTKDEEDDEMRDSGVEHIWPDNDMLSASVDGTGEYPAWAPVNKTDDSKNSLSVTRCVEFPTCVHVPPLAAPPCAISPTHLVLQQTHKHCSSRSDGEKNLRRRRLRRHKRPLPVVTGSIWFPLCETSHSEPNGGTMFTVTYEGLLKSPGPGYFYSNAVSVYDPSR